MSTKSTFVSEASEDAAALARDIAALINTYQAKHYLLDVVRVDVQQVQRLGSPRQAYCAVQVELKT